MIKIFTVIGARPQIIKAAALSRAIAKNYKDSILEIICHTGQHYDENMSEVFFTELGIPKPDYNLNVGSGSHGSQTAIMIEKIELLLIKEDPDYIVLYGDTNSTLAGAIAASKIHIPIVHIEAGLRSFNKKMPEEINRIVCDHVSTLLFSPTLSGYNNLLNDGFRADNKGKATADNPFIYHCGDIMYDNSMYFADVAEEKTTVVKDLGLEKNKFVLATIHRNNNTDEPARLEAIFSAFDKISNANKIDVVLPLHPRTAKLLEKNLSSKLYSSINKNPHIKIIEPVSFLQMISLEKNAAIILTDSGGVQKEAYFFEKPCLILRSETEWVELVIAGAAVICDADENKIIDSFNTFVNKKDLKFEQIFGNGKAAEFICGEILKANG